MSENGSTLITQREEQYRYVIEDLKPATLYNVSVVAWSPAGYGQSDTQSHTTKYSGKNGGQSCTKKYCKTVMLSLTIKFDTRCQSVSLNFMDKDNPV